MLKKIIAVTVGLGLGLAYFGGGMVLSNNLKDDNYAIVLAEKKEDINSLSSQLADLKDQISSKDEENITLQNQYEELEESNSQLNLQYQDLLNQSKVDKQQIQSLNENIANLNSRISELEAEIEKLNNSQKEISDEIYKLVDVVLNKPIFIGNISDLMTDYYVVSFYNDQEAKYETWGYDRSQRSISVLSDVYAITDILIYKDKAYATVLSGSKDETFYTLIKIIESNYFCDFAEIHGDFARSYELSKSFIFGTDINGNDCILLQGVHHNSNDEEIILEINYSSGICQKEIMCKDLLIEDKHIDRIYGTVLDNLGFVEHSSGEPENYNNIIRYVNGEFVRTVPIYGLTFQRIENCDYVIWSNSGSKKYMFSNLNTNQFIQVDDMGSTGEPPFTYDAERNVIIYKTTDSQTYEIDVATMTKKLVS